MQSITKPIRNIGLDITRSMAICLVLIAHYSLFFHGQINISPILHGFGFLGVELFFVLSGFLIGKILIAAALENNNFAAIITFCKKRCYRILPAYFLIWSILYVASDHNPMHMLHIVMLQNFLYEHSDAFFTVSWTLAAEFWFYFVAALLLLVLIKFRNFKHKKVFLYICVATAVLAPILRIIAALGFEQTWADIRRSSFIRLDAFGYGVLIATIQYYYPNIYKFLVKIRYALLAISMTVLVCCATQFLDVAKLKNIFNKALLFSIIDLLLLPVIICTESNSHLDYWRGTFKAKLVLFTSTTSYAVYLVHWDVMSCFLKTSLKVNNLIYSIAMLILCIPTTYIIAYLIYRFWEKPFLARRDQKYTRSHIMTLNSSN